MAPILTAADARPMSFETHRLAGDGRASRWRWTVYAYPDLAFLRDGQVDGDCDKAERAARAAIAIMGGIVEPSGATHGPHCAESPVRTEVEDP